MEAGRLVARFQRHRNALALLAAGEVERGL
jgi:hypothetical protein